VSFLWMGAIMPGLADPIGHLARNVSELAAEGFSARQTPSRRFPRRIRDNAKQIALAHRVLSLAVSRNEAVPAEAEWLLDNYYVIEDVVRQIYTHLPRQYYRELPIIQSGPMAGLPRVYTLASKIIGTGESSPTEADMLAALKEYQQTTALTIGEIWAVPIMLRLAVLELLRQLCDQILGSLTEREHARYSMLAAKIQRKCRLKDSPSDAYALCVWDTIREEGAPTEEVAEWLRKHLNEPHTLSHREFNRQAKNQVSIGNAVTTLRLLGVIDWKAFFEATSQVERLLRTDPGGIYPAQDFATRDRCRREIEELARGSGRPEADVARAIVAAAKQEQPPGHVAKYLIGEALPEFARDLHYRAPFSKWPRKWILRNPGIVYVGLMVGFTLLALFPAIAILTFAPWPIAVPAGVMITLIASEIAVGLTNFVARKITSPRVLPKLEFANGIPQECTTFVVVPTMIGSPDQADGILERLEQHALSNPEQALSFALLTDFTDSATETTATDKACTEALLRGVERLNAEHCVPHRPRFFVFHRHRQFNPSENCWMGWERKRGKLEEFLRLLRGATDTSYSVMSCAEDEIPHVKYVLTLDTDTVLPRDAARQMIATLAHPLNKPRLSPDGRRVEAGYAVLQPRVSFLYRTGFRSWFARIFAGSAGVDPYSSASSDTSMDLFARGTFTGKGLLDLDAFEATAGRAFPENAILSHDLIESNYARCALATDIEVFDEFPAKYHSYARREHRWIRGDWQLLPWLGSKVPMPHDGRMPNVLPALERWKVIDNLRRSFVAPAAVFLLVVGWLFLPELAWAWTLFIAAAWLLPTVILGNETVWQLRSQMAMRSLSHRIRFEFANTVGQAVLQLAFLTDQARLAVDAIVRTLHRVFVSHKKLLEWETAAAAEARLGTGFAQFAGTMWHSSALAVAIAAALAVFAPQNLFAAGPLLLMWFVSPVIAFLVSLPRKVTEQVLTAAEETKLRVIARTTWDFFETYVGPTDNWLPPDNFQEEPLGLVAHRTSPTNVGLYLLAVLTAHDFGYITTSEMVDRIRNAFETIDKLEKHRGHILNWYETTNLATLLPAYVSTVDSGNFLACLLALKHGLLEKAVDSTTPVFAGLAETLEVVRSVWAKEAATAPANSGIEKLIVDTGEAIAAKDLSRVLTASESLLKSVREGNLGARTIHWAERLAGLVLRHKEAAPVPNAALAELAETASKLAAGMSFGFLYNPDRELFSIGFNATTGRLDSNHYDLLASEACIASYLAIARGEVPRKHWFRLGRLVTRSGGEPGLISWGGTMFEYLMPRLLLPTARGVLLDQAQNVAVAQQIEYGREMNLPWGISESSYYAFDPGQVYKYQSFGVPGMGLKRGLDRDHVIAPYATLLAVDVDASAAIRNLARLEDAGGAGPYGYYEALDYTPERAKVDGAPNIVRSYMAHHQGMGLIAIANRLTGGIMRRRLASEPSVRASDLLLDERVPHHAQDAELEAPASDGTRKLQSADYPVRRRITTPHTPTPRTHLLSNGRYSVMLTNSGSGYSRCGDNDITRWRPDATTDADGLHIYIRDRRSGQYWSGGYQPTAVMPGEYEVTFAIDKAEIRRVDDDIETLIEIIVVPDQDVEVRRVTITNRGTKPRELDATSYCEIVLMAHAADAAHPAFGKLFLETEWLPEHNAILCRRRPRTTDQPPQFAFHVLADDIPGGSVSCETSREVFLGRRRNTAKPAMLDQRQQKLEGTTGAVLDPILSIRRDFVLKPGEPVVMAFATGMAANREEAISLAQRYRAMAAIGRAFELAWAHAGIELQGSHWKVDDVYLFQRIAGYLIYPTGPLRADPGIIAANRHGQSGLWAFGISGDLPILVLRMHGMGGLPHLRQLLQAHAYWQSKALKVDLVILLENAGGYQDDLHVEVLNQVRSAGLGDRLDRPDGVFVRKGWQMTGPDRGLLLSVARVILNDLVGPVATQVSTAPPAKPLPPKRPERLATWTYRTPRAAPLEKLQFDGGYGGFSPDGLEFVVRPEKVPPTPWVNVIANPSAGFLVTDSGGGYVWAGNSQSNRITPWSNDPVSDPPGDAIYIYDEESQALWCPTPLPIPSETAVTVRHGQGYTVFDRRSEDITSELTMFAPAVDPVKISVLKLHNTGTRLRRLEIAYYAEWVLGTTREVTSTHIVTELDAETGALFARNRYNPDFSGRVAFADAELRPRSATGDRREFLGRNGSTAAPASFGRLALSGTVGPSLDPCAAIRGAITLSPGEERTVVFVIGQATDEANARRIVKTYCQAEAADGALKEAVTRWDALCGTIRVETPDPAFDILMNRWLVYQTLSCRLWGRSAFYQSGGAYGFRDQLQDVCALVHTAPAEVRTHILRAARRQFLRGDVQHWWHEPAGNGVRTRFSDDFLWLPYTVAEYIRATGDLDILNAQVPYIEAPLLQPDQHEVYGIPTVSEQVGSLFEHCEKAIAYGWQLGAHGLPLMGGGDWNDGMNTVGVEGRGESVWVAWFQIVILNDFAQLADRLGNATAATEWRMHATKLHEAVEANAWDGAWYRRAYFDDGTPLGSATNDECKIDSLAQSWAVIAGGDPERAGRSMDAVMQQLVKPADRLILLFTPPFDAGPLKPGYIKGYLPGVRENGGQYTHAAAWVVKALAGLGRGDAAHAAFAQINPIAASQDKYRGEPYVVAGDVYSSHQHAGRAGWTWYTGSSSWMYRVGLEDILGIHREAASLRFNPCVPAAWKRFAVRYRFGKTLYRIEYDNTAGVQQGVASVTSNGSVLPDGVLPLVDDSKEHAIIVKLGTD
jgi:cyclic beta-1,2-glucan synthetase